MRVKRYLLSAAFLLAVTVADAQSVIPAPQVYEEGKGSFHLDGNLVLDTNLQGEERKDIVEYLELSPLGVCENPSKRNGARLRLEIVDELDMGNEGYELEVGKKQIEIRSKTSAGLFYGVQTLLQLAEETDYVSVPAVKVEDEPRFPYRGLHLDVSRHFRSKGFIIKQLDAMARYKLNRLHWHLTDGAGWRIEIKKYPRLTNFAAWRPCEKWETWWAGDRHYCDADTPGAYGGFYTREDVAEVLEHARKLHITVIPEIELPGHSEEVTAAYPYLSCANDMYKNSDFCIGKEASFAFLEDVLTEVIDMFPSHYIHIGGDEASKQGWKNCTDCQKRMRNEGLQDVDELQSYMIHRIERFVNSKGRDIIGWDEILEGGLAPNATVMSWRGEEGGIRAARAGHKVVMTPGSFCYLDSYQADPRTEPKAIGGYLPVEKVYSYDPVPASLEGAERKMILGVQGNVWAEYIPTDQHMEYMIYPRIIAIAEVGWTQPYRKNWENFKRRINIEIPKLVKRGYHPFTLSSDVRPTTNADYAGKQLLLSLDCEKQPVNIRYTTDGSDPTSQSLLYMDTIRVSDSIRLKACVFEGGKPAGRMLSERYDYHKAIGKKVVLAQPHSKQYPADGSNSLVDGLRGGLGYGDNRWLGFLDQDLDAVIDLGEEMELSYISSRFMQSKGPYVWLPKYFMLQVSTDGINFTDLAKLAHNVSEDDERVLFHDFTWMGKTKARYVKCFAPLVDTAGAWLFVDEIVVQ